MRVLHLTTHLNIGGITTYIERLIKPMRDLGAETYVLSSGGEKSQHFKNLGAQVFELPIKTKSILDPRIWFAIPAVKKIIADNHIDLIHAHTRITQFLAAQMQKQLPVVTTCHGFYKPNLGRKLFPCWGDRVIAISLIVQEHLEKDFKVPRQTIRQIFNAVNLQDLDREFSKHSTDSAKAHFGFEPSDRVVGIVARLVEDKGQDYLIRAAHQLRQKIPNLKVLIVGDGKFRPQLESLVIKLGMQSQVCFAGNLADITLGLAAMDAFALPATWREGFGLSIIEAMTCRRPIVVTNIWSLNSLIHDRQTGLIVEPKQVEPLANAIETLLTDQALVQDITSRARAMVEKHFSIERMAGEIVSVYRELYSRKS